MVKFSSVCMLTCASSACRYLAIMGRIYDVSRGSSFYAAGRYVAAHRTPCWPRPLLTTPLLTTSFTVHATVRSTQVVSPLRGKRRDAVVCNGVHAGGVSRSLARRYRRSPGYHWGYHLLEISLVFFLPSVDMIVHRWELDCQYFYAVLFFRRIHEWLDFCNYGSCKVGHPLIR